MKSCDAGAIMVLMVFINAVVIYEGLVNSTQWYWLLSLTIPLLIIAAFWHRLKKTKR